MDAIFLQFDSNQFQLRKRKFSPGAGLKNAERSPLAKAAAGLLVVVGKTTRGFESLPSPPSFFNSPQTIDAAGFTFPPSRTSGVQ
jgi:hypothetical protein